MRTPGVHSGLHRGIAVRKVYRLIRVHLDDDVTTLGAPQTELSEQLDSGWPPEEPLWTHYGATMEGPWLWLAGAELIQKSPGPTKDPLWSHYGATPSIGGC